MPAHAAKSTRAYRGLRGLLSCVIVASLVSLLFPVAATAADIDPWRGPTGGGTEISGQLPAPTFTDVVTTPNESVATTFAIGSDGNVYAWGDNTYGQLGNGTTSDPVLLPQPVSLPAAALPVVSIAPAVLGGFAVGADGNVYAWGSNANGQAGNGTVGGDLLLPVKVTLPTAALPARTVTGYNGASVLGADGNVYSWGSNVSGQVGNGTVGGNVLTPVRSRIPSDALPITRVSKGGNTTYALGANGAVYAWGDNSSRSVGNGSPAATVPTPGRVSLPPEALPATDISGSALGGSAIGTNGRLYVWGGNTSVQLGNGTINSYVPTPIEVVLPHTAYPVTHTAGDAATRYALGADDTLYAWGSNTRAQTGTSGAGTTTPVVVPLPPEAHPVSQINGAASGYVLNSFGELFSWGNNKSGQLANGTIGSAVQVAPSRVKGLDVTGVTVGGSPAADLQQWPGREGGESVIFWSARTPPGCGPAVVTVSWTQSGESRTRDQETAFRFGSSPTFDLHPPSSSTPFGGTFTTTAAVSGDPAPALQWQQQQSDGTWADLKGATHATLSVPGVKTTTSFRVVATNCSSGPVASEPATATVITDVQISGSSRVLEVPNGDPALALADPRNWDITATAGDITSIIDEGGMLERGKAYTIRERLRSSPEPDSSALRYTRAGTVNCSDSTGGELSREIYDPTTGRLLIVDGQVIAEPITCHVANQTSHVTVWTARIGGRTVPPTADWTLTATHADARFGFTLEDTSPTAQALPSQYNLAAAVPGGLSVVGIEKLDLSQPGCATLANNADQAPSTCWVRVGGAEAQDIDVLPAHNVYRIVAGTPADMPSLPLTGGLGSWLFTVGGIGALAVGGGLYLSRRIRKAPAVFARLPAFARREA